MRSYPTSTLLLPMLNEIEAARVIVPQIDKSWVDEIIVIDGGSTDGTIEYCKSQGLRVESQPKRGFGAGMQQGLRLARGDVVIEFMPDGNSIPADIPRLLAKIHEGYDLVIASRYAGEAQSDDDDRLTAFGNMMFTAIVNWMFWAHYSDVLVGTRAFRRDKALAMHFDAPGLSWPCQSSIRFARAGLQTAEIPAREPARIGGTRKMRPFKTGWEITRLILRDFFTFWPSRRGSHGVSRSGN